MMLNVKISDTVLCQALASIPIGFAAVTVMKHCMLILFFLQYTWYFKE